MYFLFHYKVQLLAVPFIFPALYLVSKAFNSGAIKRCFPRLNTDCENDMDWIEINLPWHSYNYEDCPVRPTLTKKIKKEFGTTQDEAYKKLTKKDRKEYSKYSDEYDDYLRDNNLEVDDFNEELRKLHGHIPGVAKTLAYRDLRSKIEAWENSQPEIIEFHNKLKAYNQTQEEKSFVGRKLNKPGTLIEVETNGKIQRYLIGDINTLRGVCDDCVSFDNPTIVKRYKVICTPEELPCDT
jgi:hypothetical protein